MSAKNAGPVVGLVRHRLTERVDSSLASVFSSIERATAMHFPARCCPPHLSLLPPQDRDRGWREFLSGCDLLVTPSPGFIHQFRGEGKLSFRMVMTPLGSFPRGALNFRSSGQYIRGGDLIVFSSTADRVMFNQLFACCPADQLVIPLPVDTQVFLPPQASRREELRRQFGFRESDVVFLYVGRVTAEKNVHASLSLMDTLMARHPQVRFLVVGPAIDQKFREFNTGPYDLENILHQIIANSPRLAERVLLLPWTHRELLPSLYGAADVFLNLTLHHDENFGYGQVEAMSCGLPVVGTDWGGLKDTIVHGVTGFRIPTVLCGRGVQIDRWKAIQACDALATSASLRQRLGRAGRERAVLEYDQPLFERRWRDALNFAARPGVVDGPSELSEFGDRFNRSFSGQQPLYTPETYRLYRELIQPYGSGVLNGGAAAGDVLFLQPLSFELTANEIDVRDLLWPGTYAVDEIQHRIITLLETNQLEGDSPFLRRCNLADALPQLAPTDIDRALAALMERGIVGSSEGTVPCAIAS